MEKIEQVRAIVADALNRDRDEVQPETTLAEMGADSLDCVELQMMLEEDFRCDIADDAVMIEMTVQQLADLVTPFSG